jgi:hypothetical protein
MGTAEIIPQNILLIQSHIITYGDMADESITQQITDEMETMWNEPQASVYYKGSHYTVVFRITASWQPDIAAEEILGNINPLNNYFRIEAKAMGNISFVDGLGCNTGYFQYDNLYKGSTTAAHEYGHTLGLPHPHDLDIRGQGSPGIMYPRGTLVDPEFQYDPHMPAGLKGGTMHPMFRKVRQQDIHDLQLHKLPLHNNAIVGSFSSNWHPAFH